MKTLLILIISLILFSCNQEKAASDKELPEFVKDIYVTDNTKIIGIWKICSESGNGQTIQYNVCPTVSFLNNGSGYMERSSTRPEHFGWSLRKGVLNIRHSQQAINTFFSDTVYHVIIDTQAQKLILVNQQKKYNAFYLSK